MAHRGRFQAQGKRLEKSECWAQDQPLPVGDGLELIEKLKKRLSTRELKIRERAFKKCKEIVIEASHHGGINVGAQGKPFIKSFSEGNVERVDLEVHKGIAFVNI
jgi:hypothetical protein